MKIVHPVVRGHPLHAILSDGPAALIPVALVAAALARLRPDERTRFASDGATALALGTGLVAAAVGWWDWLTIPAEHPARRPATIHGLVNSGGLVLGAAALVFRPRRLELLAVLTGSLLIGAWIGGDLVFRLGWRVRPAEELELLQDELGGAIEAPLARARERIDRHERDETLL